MTPEEQNHERKITRYQRFCDEHNLVASDPASEKEYHQWILLQMKIDGENRAFWENFASMINDPEAMRRSAEESKRKLDAMERHVEAVAKTDKDVEEMLNQYREERRAEDCEERRAERRVKMALNLKSLGTVSYEDIIKVTGLTIAEIEAL